MATQPIAFARRFPLGVLSDDGTAAYIGDEIPHIVALDLQSGHVLWRAAVSGRPIAASAQQVVVARQALNLALELDILSAVDGKHLSTRTIAPAFPAWADANFRPQERFAYRCSLAGANLDIEWRATQHYEGGAPPSQKVVETNRRTDSGVLHIDLVSGHSQCEARAIDFHAGKAEPLAVLASPAREICMHGQFMYYLVDEPIDANSGRTTLRAVQRGSEETMWEYAVRTWKASRPRALRP